MQQTATTLAPTPPTSRRRVLAWTPEQVDLLTERWAAGATALQIATDLGDPDWRNAVIGKATRLGLERRNANAGRPRGGAKALETAGTASAAIPAPRVPDGLPKPSRVAVAATPRETVAVDLPGPAPRQDPATAGGGVAIHDLEHHHCRWPLNDVPRGDGERLLYCGAPQVERENGKLGPYCGHHKRIAYTPTARTERQPLRDGVRLGRAA